MRFGGCAYFSISNAFRETEKKKAPESGRSMALASWLFITSLPNANFSFRCGFRFYLDSAFCMIMRQPASQWQLKVFGPEKQNYENLVSTLSTLH